MYLPLRFKILILVDLLSLSVKKRVSSNRKVPSESLHLGLCHWFYFSQHKRILTKPTGVIGAQWVSSSATDRPVCRSCLSLLLTASVLFILTAEPQIIRGTVLVSCEKTFDDELEVIWLSRFVLVSTVSGKTSAKVDQPLTYIMPRSLFINKAQYSYRKGSNYKHNRCSQCNKPTGKVSFLMVLYFLVSGCVFL